MFDLLEFLKENWIPLTTTIGAVWLYFSERKKRHIEGRIGVNDATEGMQNMYDKFVTDADQQFEKLSQKITKLQENEKEYEKYKEDIAIEILTMKDELNTYKNRVADLGNKVLEYEMEIHKYKEQVKNLKSELNRYKNTK